MHIHDAGVFIRKKPKYKDELAYLAVEINPIGENGLPINKMGINIKNQHELDTIRDILSQQIVDEALHSIEQVNPKY